MKKIAFSVYFKNRLSEISQFIFNIFIFLPYYFSISQLLKTFFKPWKNLYQVKETEGFSLDEWFRRTSFNLISAGIGASLRLSVILLYLVIQSSFVIIIPIIIFIFLAITPLTFFISFFKKDDQLIKKELEHIFINSHLIKQENYQLVKKWFEIYYEKRLKKTHWWSRENLFSQPPLARDWDRGYTPNLNKYSCDLTSLFAHYEHLVDREKEIKIIEQVLSKSNESNALIVGEEGVGKHTIIEAFAKKLFQGHCSPVLAFKRVIKIDMEKVLSQYQDPFQKTELFKILLQEAVASKNIIILIDEIHQYLTSDLLIDLSSIIGEFAKLNTIQFIGITTPFFYQKYIFNNEKIGRFFEKIDVYEIQKDEAEMILLDLALDYEEKYRIKISYEAIKEIINKSANYITYIPFPEKAIKLLDEACVYTQQNNNKFLTPQIIDQILQQKIHVPLIITPQIREKLLNIESLLKKEIFFQDEAILKIAATLRKSFVISNQRKKPLASFLFLGPSGVGKTETAKVLAKQFFGSEKNLIRFDMSLYQQKEDISNLIGSTINNNPGLLIKALREKPYGVLLLDEIEKANKDLLNIFLTLLDEGYITDAFGKKVDGKNLVIIATSNAGSDYINKIITNHQDVFNDDLNLEFFNYLVENKYFSPEFLNRFDGIIIYRPLTKEAIVKIIEKKLNNLKNELNEIYKIKVNFSQNFINSLVLQSHQSIYGARNIDRVIRDETEDLIAKMILLKRLKEGDEITI